MSRSEPYSDEWYRQKKEERKELQQKLLDRWDQRLQQLFNGSLPGQARWATPDAIADTLDAAAQPEEGDSHALLSYPDSGDYQLVGARTHAEDGCIELQTSTDPGTGGTVLRPHYMKLVVPSGDTRLAYFWLEAGQLAPSGVYDEIGDDVIYEDLCEVRPGQYRRRAVCERGALPGGPDGPRPLPNSARTVLRYLEGAFLVSCKASPYQTNAPTTVRPGPADGLHAELGSGQFRKLIQELSLEL